MTPSYTEYSIADSLKIVRMKDGVSVAVPDSYHHITPYVLEEQQDWFEDETDFLRAFLKPAMKVIDIGANFGIYSLIAASQVGKGGHVWSFEPTTVTAAYLNRSLQINGFDNVTLLQQALSDTTRTARLKLEENCEMNRLLGNDQTGLSEEISVLSLDQAVSKYGIKDIDFLKLDAEGEESRIIGGAQAFWMNESPLVMFEFKHNEEINSDLIEAFATLGFKMYRFHKGPGVLVPFQKDAPLDPLWLNLFCCRADRATTLEKKNLLTTEPPEDNALPEGDSCDMDCSDPTEVMQTVIRLFELSNDRYYPAAQRINALYSAFKLAQERFVNEPSLPRLSTLARLANALGYRRRAYDYMSLAKDRLDSFVALEGDVFLPAESRFDGQTPNLDLKEWFTAMVYTVIEKSQKHSSYYAPLEALQNLEKIMSTGYVDDDIQRRFALIRNRIQEQQA